MYHSSVSPADGSWTSRYSPAVTRTPSGYHEHEFQGSVKVPERGVQRIVVEHALISGRYRVGARLGGGGMAVVNRAHDERLDREVAIKFLDVARGMDRESRRRFEREARLAASINHPNV